MVLTLFLSPLLALGATVALVVGLQRVGRLLGRAGPAVFVLRAALAATAFALLGAFWLPTVPMPGRPPSARPGCGCGRNGLQSDERERYDLAVSLHEGIPASSSAHLVGNSPVFDPYATRLVSEVLGLLTRQPQLAGDREDLCQGIALSPVTDQRS